MFIYLFYDRFLLWSIAIRVLPMQNTDSLGEMAQPFRHAFCGRILSESARKQATIGLKQHFHTQDTRSRQPQNACGKGDVLKNKDPGLGRLGLGHAPGG
jgi:hypothetical protein